ncbi:MAG: hypothetical protein NZ528_11815 [Caldilineales bacterium]|nr:hypothetical protein [Caldilineales bacterium]
MADSPHHHTLNDGDRVAVIGGGPAGAFFAYFLLVMARGVGRSLAVDIYEPRDFAQLGARGCNGCAGIVSERLMQTFAEDGIELPPAVVQRTIDAYVLHMDVGSARITPPHQDTHIASVYRGAGPRELRGRAWVGLDAYVLDLAQRQGAQVVRERVNDVAWVAGRPAVGPSPDQLTRYDLVAVTSGVNSAILKQFAEAIPGYQPPRTTKTYIREYFLGSATVDATLGNAIQVFLLDIPGLEFGMLIPKGEYVTACLLGEDMEGDLMERCLAAPEVRRVVPMLSADRPSCQCAPRINVAAAEHPFGDRVVFIGDCAATRLYKDGIGSAYRTAKAAAATAVLHGVGADDFRRHYLPACTAIEQDNQVGRLIFALVSQMRRHRFARRTVLQSILDEQGRPGRLQPMSAVQWDMYTGSGSYRQIARRLLDPRLLWSLVRGGWGAAFGRWLHRRSATVFHVIGHLSK